MLLISAWVNCMAVIALTWSVVIAASICCIKVVTWSADWVALGVAWLALSPEGAADCVWLCTLDQRVARVLAWSPVTARDVPSSLKVPSNSWYSSERVSGLPELLLPWLLELFAAVELVVAEEADGLDPALPLQALNTIAARSRHGSRNIPPRRNDLTKMDKSL